jgi:glyoxylase-like metal-dependent hydrolase (beta-lactamase superfamily II)
MLFDLGIKRNISGYRTAQQDHIAQRQPVILSPDARESLIAGGMQPEDIDIVVLSHVHWDHVGTSFDFVNAQFVVGSGTLDVLENGDGPYYPADLFNSDELPLEQTHELPPVAGRNSAYRPRFGRETKHVWKEIQGLGPAVDFFGDGAVWVVDAPGHLTGHVNLLVRTGPRKWVYLGGDCCHDPRILHGESEIALYNDGKGALRSVHMDTEMARETIGRVSRLAKSAKEGKVVENGNEESSVEVEVVVAHDAEWRETNRGRFWPGCL